MSALAQRRNALREVAGGMAAVSVKELRGRMRGRRAFVLLTVHLLAVSGFAFFVEEVAVQSISPFGGGPQSADIGRMLFDAVLVFLTIVVLILAPASTSGAISLEREKQTLDLLVTTPVSSLAIVLGKLIAALGWMALLVLGSIPIMALVFMFGGVGPEDLLRAYLMLSATAILYGSLGLFISALFKRTQASTVLNLVLAVVFTLGSGGLYGGLFALSVGDLQQKAMERNVSADWSTFKTPPQVLLWLNPFAGDVDVMCHADASLNGMCYVVLVFNGRIDMLQGGGALMPNGQPLAAPEDTYWPVSVAAMLVMSMLLIAGATQLISPTRRWRRPRRGTGEGALLVPAPATATPDLPPAEAADVVSVPEVTVGRVAPPPADGAVPAAEDVAETGPAT